MNKENKESKKPKIDALAVLKRAVDKAIRRKKALGQYAVVYRDGKIQKIQF